MSEMTWKALISVERFIGIGVEFQVAVRNTHGHLSQTVGLGGLLLQDVCLTVKIGQST